MNNKDDLIKKDLVPFENRFGVIKKNITYESLSGNPEEHQLFMFVDDTSKKGCTIFVHSYGLCCMIFGNEETERFYFTEKNPYASFVRLDVCINGSLFSESFLEKIKNGRESYDHFVGLAMDGVMAIGSSIMYATSTYLDDFFSSPNPDIEYLRKIISNKDPSCYGLWQRLIIHKYQEFMPNVVTRSIHHVVDHGKVPLLSLRIIFATMISEEPAVRRIIEQQLIARNELKNLEFFRMHFIPFIKAVIDILINYPYYHDEMQWVFAGTIARIQFAWRSKSMAVCKITVDKRRQTMDDLATNARIKKAAKKPKTQAKRGKRNNQKKTRIGRKGRQ